MITYFDEPHFFELAAGVDVRCLGMRANRGRLARAADVLRAALAFRRLVAELKPAFVLSFMNKYNAFAIASLFGSGVPVIASERGSPTEALPRSRVLARDLLYQHAAGIICQTNAGMDFIASRTAVRDAVVIPNPVRRIIDPAERQPQQVVLSVGRFVPSKAFDQLIDAFADMSHRDWRLVLCGDGPMRAELERQVELMGLNGRVEFAGLTNDLRPHYRRAAIFAFSSLHEGYPNALAEAMASGLPCVSYDCPTGPSDIIATEERGVLVPVGDVGALTAALDRLARDRDLAERLGASAYAWAESLDPMRIAERFLNFCEQAARAESAR